MAGSVRRLVEVLCRVGQFLAYPAVVVQGRSSSTYPGVVVQGRLVRLQGVTAHSPPVAGAVVSRGDGVQGKSIRNLPCRLTLQPRLPTALTAWAAVRSGRDPDWKKATDFLFPEVYLLLHQLCWFGRWASVSQDIKFVSSLYVGTTSTPSTPSRSEWSVGQVGRYLGPQARCADGNGTTVISASRST